MQTPNLKNLWDAAKAVHRRKFIVLTTYFEKKVLRIYACMEMS
jgi:hypothetical protein